MRERTSAHGVKKQAYTLSAKANNRTIPIVLVNVTVFLKIV